MSDTALKQSHAMPWQESAGCRALEAAFAAANMPLFYVGGCVRDLLLERPIGDIDAATPATPPEVQALLEKADIRSLPTGIEFGTVSALLPQGDGWETFEITTFREDIATDGRHAQVRFGTDMKADAARRDFTINALYFDPAGALHDPTGQGVADIAARRLRFIGEATQRITEDGLRILRFYRFAAQLGLSALDETARLACARATDRITSLSGERIQSEMRKLLKAPMPGLAWDALRTDGVLGTIVPGAPHAARVDKAAKVEDELGVKKHGTKGDPWLRLAYLIGTQSKHDSAPWIAERWRLSRVDAAQFVWLTATAQARPPLNTALLKQLARQRGKNDALRVLALAWLGQTGHPKDQLLTWAEMLHAWEIPAFPLRGQDLIALGYTPGTLLGRALTRLEAIWEEHDYALDHAALLEYARQDMVNEGL